MLHIVYIIYCIILQDFPGRSAGKKKSGCNARDPSSIPGLGRSLGEGKGYPLQCSGLENSIASIVHEVKSAVFVSRQKLMGIVVTEDFTLT